MPNWCYNTLTLTHEDPAMLERVETAFNNDSLLSDFIPIPEDLKIISGYFPEGSPEQIETQALYKANMEKYGYTTWYDFCVEEWGTKWDIKNEGFEPTIVDNSITLSFDSAWAPPLAAYKKFEDMGFDVLAYYHEPGMCFCGRYKAGEDESYNIDGDAD